LSVANGRIGSSGGKKTAQAIQKEVAQEIDQLLQVIFAALRKSGRLDLEAVEMATRSAMHQAGAAVLKELLQKSRNEVAREVACPCGQQARFHEMRPKQILTVLGRIYMQRAYYVCGHCHDGQSPLDCELDIVGTECSPGVRRMMALVGSDGPFEHGRRQIEELAGLDVTSKTIERHSEGIGEDIIRREEAEVQRAIQLDLPEVHVADIPMMYVEMDGTGVPVVASETEGRVGKIEGQSARTREAKLGCVFTQVGLDKEGYPQRDPHSTTYVGAIESSTLFGWRLYTEALRRGLEQAPTVVVLTDGARYNHTIIQTHFSAAVHIVDLFHAYEHLTALAQILWGPEAKAPKAWRDWLEAGDIGRLIRQASKQLPASAKSKKSMLKQLRYFANNAPQMRYAEYREKKFFVGSGVVEAGCRTVIGERLKQSGMRWSVRGANAIIALRCCILSGRFEDFWASRAP